MTMRRVNATGRSTGRHKVHKRAQAAMKPFVMLPLRLLSSPSWMSLSINARRVVDRLICEHMNKAALMNGGLIVTYDQLVAAGCSRSLICASIGELVDNGLVEVTQVGGIGLGIKRPSTYRLTFLPADGHWPTHEWKGLSLDTIRKRAADRRAAEERRKRSKRDRRDRTEAAVGGRC